MKSKLFALTVAAVASTYSYADVTKVALYGNTAPLYLADASSVTQPRIQGINAAGENQTTIIDSNGNLKIVDRPANNNVPTTGPSSGNMSNNNPNVDAPTTTPDGLPVTPTDKNNNQDMRPSTSNPINTNAAPGSGNLPNNALPNTAPGIAPNNAPGATPGMAPGVAPAGR